MIAAVCLIGAGLLLAFVAVVVLVNMHTAVY